MSEAVWKINFVIENCKLQNHRKICAFCRDLLQVLLHICTFVEIYYKFYYKFFHICTFVEIYYKCLSKL
jgi:hypothetical protein